MQSQRSLALLVVPALVLAGLAVSGCSTRCNCPQSGGVANVPLPAAQSSPITSVSATAPCTATVSAAGGVTVYTPGAVTCAVEAQLMNGDTYTFTVAFQATSADRCCPGVETFNASVPQLVGADAGVSAAQLPVVPSGCGATCSTPAGLVQPLTDLASIAAAVEGRWHICGSWPGGTAPSDVVGIEFDVASVTQESADGAATLESGNAYYLVSGPSGAVPGAGFDYQLTYDFELWTNSSGYLAIHPTPNSGFAGAVRFSPCPVELQINFDGASGAVLVPFGT